MRARGNAHIAELYLGAQSTSGLGSKWAIVRVQMLAVSCSIKLQFRKTKTEDFDILISKISINLVFSIRLSGRVFSREI